MLSLSSRVKALHVTFFLKSLNAQMLLILTFISPIVEYHTYKRTEENKGDSLTYDHTMKKRTDSLIPLNPASNSVFPLVNVKFRNS